MVFVTCQGLRDEKYGLLPDIFQLLKNANTSILFILYDFLILGQLSIKLPYLTLFLYFG